MVKISDEIHSLFVGATIDRPLLSSSDLGSMLASTPTNCAFILTNRWVRCPHRPLQIVLLLHFAFFNPEQYNNIEKGIKLRQPYTLSAVKFFRWFM